MQLKFSDHFLQTIQGTDLLKLVGAELADAAEAETLAGGQSLDGVDYGAALATMQLTEAQRDALAQVGAGAQLCSRTPPKFSLCCLL